MWVPRTWQEVDALLGETETATLDFKRDLPAKGKGAEAGKDVAAMALNGGVVIYGIDEDKQTLEATDIPKIPLAGAPEKLQAMVGANVSPVPYIEPIVLKENAGDMEGVLVISVPPSAQAPHMVSNRYPVRRGTTTEYLDEPEVARLYERRRELAGPVPSEAELVQEFKVPPDASQALSGSLLNGMGVMRMLVRPQTSGIAHPESPRLGDSLRVALGDARDGIGQRLSVARESDALASFVNWHPAGTLGWTVGHVPMPQNELLRKSGLAALLSYPAAFSFAFSWPLFVWQQNGQQDYKCAYEWKVAVELMACLGIAGGWFEQLADTGPVVCLVELAGYDNALSFEATRGRPEMRPPGADTAPAGHVESTLTTVSELREAPEAVGRRLIDRWLVAFHSGRPELFESVLT